MKGVEEEGESGGGWVEEMEARNRARMVLTSQPVPEAAEELLELPAVEDAVLVQVEQLVEALQVVELVIVDLQLVLMGDKDRKEERKNF